MALQTISSSVYDESEIFAELVLPDEIKKSLIMLEKHFILDVGFDLDKINEEKIENDVLFRNFRCLLRNAISDYGVILLKNLPVDEDLIKTPVEYINPIDKKSYHSETALFVLALLLGEVKTYSEEHYGSKIHNVYPVRRNKYTRSGSGGSVDLKYHTEIAFDRDRPDYIILSCLRAGRQKIPTVLSGKIKDKFNKLNLLEKRILSENIFFIRPPDSFSSENNVYYRLPLVEYSGIKQVFRFNFNKDIIYCNNIFAIKTLTKLYDFLDDSRLEICLEPGTGLIIDNNSFLHARSSYNPAYDGSDRWLQRVYVKLTGDPVCVK